MDQAEVEIDKTLIKIIPKSNPQSTILMEANTDTQLPHSMPPLGEDKNRIKNEPEMKGLNETDLSTLINEPEEEES